MHFLVVAPLLRGTLAYVRVLEAQPASCQRMLMSNIGIGALSRQTGTPIETIRYYERIGLLPVAKRGLNKRRFYSEADVTLLSFIRQARELGFNLADVRELLSLRKDRACSPVAAIATRHLSAVRAKLNALQAIEIRLASALDGRSDVLPDCSVLQAMEANASTGEQLSPGDHPPLIESSLGGD